MLSERTCHFYHQRTLLSSTYRGIIIIYSYHQYFRIIGIHYYKHTLLLSAYIHITGINSHYLLTFVSSAYVFVTSVYFYLQHTFTSSTHISIYIRIINMFSCHRYTFYLSTYNPTFSTLSFHQPIFVPSGYSQRRGTARTSQFSFFSIIFISLYYVYCLCVNLLCTAATGCQPNCGYIYKSYHIISTH
jgi:hypothetical protein